MVSESTTNYSLYPNGLVRISLHFLLWALIYVFYLTLNKDIFRTELFASPNIIYSVLVVSIIACNHYFLCHVMRVQLERRRWVNVLIAMLISYVFTAFFLIWPLQYLSESYAEYPIIKILSGKYHIVTFLDVFRYDAFLWVFSVVIVYTMLTFFLKFAKDNYIARIEKISLVEEKNKMEMSFLRSQIQPHFLFNTLNNIYGQVLDNEQASQAILKLSGLLRFSLYGSSKGVVKLKEEIKFLTDYISLEKMRHKDSKVDIQYCFDEISHPDLEISPLILVNFVENAFKHGVNASIGNSWANIVLKEKEKVVTFSVSNSIGKSGQQKKAVGGLGLENVRRRLDLEYPGRYDLSIKETLDRYDVVLTLKTNML